jgi:prephenate dehydratase
MLLPHTPQDQLANSRIAFQGEPGAFSEAAALKLLGRAITTIPRPTFDAAFRAVAEGAADALLAPIENSLAGSVLRVYDLLLESALLMVAEVILPIEHHLIAIPGTKLEDIRTVASHPMALAQCQRFFSSHPHLKRVPAEDTAGSVREVLARGERAAAAIAGRRAAEHYRAAILLENVEDNAENFTRFVLLVPAPRAASLAAPGACKMSVALRLAHRPGSLLAALQPFAAEGVNLLKIESRPLHGRPWEYQFFLDIEADEPARIHAAVDSARASVSELRVLGLYAAARAAEARSHSD